MNPTRSRFLLTALGVLAFVGCKTSPEKMGPEVMEEAEQPSEETVAGTELEALGAGGAPCTTASWHWSSTTPAVNRLHVFCGEIGAKDKKPKGFHSIVHQSDSPYVTGVSNKTTPRNGIYNGTVAFTAPASPSSKMSTFFPDACTEDQLMKSIVYAANNKKPKGSWSVGPSAPTPADTTYCLDSKGNAFPIRLGVLSDGRVNTAFPD